MNQFLPNLFFRLSFNRSFLVTILLTIVSLPTLSLASDANSASHTTSGIKTDPASNVDNIIPPAPAAPDMTAGTDTGISNTDNITNNNTPGFSGSGTNGDTIDLLSDVDGNVGSTVVVGGTWNITASVLADGPHNMTVTATDGTGTSLPSPALAITIDTSAPGAPTSPDMTAATDSNINSDDITNDNTPDFVNSADDSGNNGETVQLMSSVDGNVGSGAISGGNWTITASTLSDGPHNITAVITDLAGNAGTSAVLAVTIDTSAPAAPSVPDLTAGTDSNINNDNITNNNTPDFVNSADDSGNNGETVQLISSVEGNVGSGAIAGGNWSITAATLSTGNHNITAEITDVAGNTGTSGILAITIDTSAPGAPAAPDMTAGTDSNINTDNITNDNTPDFTGSGTNGETINLISNVDGNVGSVVVAGGTWTITATTLAAGAHNMTATATDVAGNTGPASTALGITIDTSAPTFTTTLASPNSGTRMVGQAVALTITATGAEAGLDAGTTITVNGINVKPSFVDNADGTYSLNYVVAEGNTDRALNALPINIDIQDDAGNSTNIAAFSDGNAPAIDGNTPSAPIGLDLDAADDSNINTDNITNIDLGLTISGSAGSAEALSTIQLFDGGTPIGGATTAAAGDGSWTIDIALTETSHNITATATDASGNESPASSVLAITVDKTAPGAPAAPDMTAGTDSNINTDNITSDSTPDFTGSGTNGETINLISSVDGNVGSVVVAGGTWTITSTTLAAGAHNMTATATDVAGNTGPASTALGITIDTSPPTFTSTLASPNSGTRMVGQVVAITITATGVETGLDAGTTITVNGINVKPSFVDNADGTYSLNYVVAEGNTDRALNALPINIDIQDDAGNSTNIAAFSDGNAPAIDGNTPAAPTGLDLDAADDSNINTDNITNIDLGLTISGSAGSAEVLSTIQLFDGGTPIGGATTAAAGDGSWTIDIALTETSHDITATATDAAGNEGSASAILTILVDKTAPGTPSTPDLKASSDTFSPFALTGTNTDNITNVNLPNFLDGTTNPENNSVVNVFSSLHGAGTISLGSGSADGTGNFDFALTTPLIDGVHSIRISATDLAGNESLKSSGLSVTIDTQPPGVIVGGVQFYNHGDHEHIDIQYNEPIDLAHDTVLDPGGFSVDAGSDYDNGSKYKTSYTTPSSNGSIAKTNLAHLRSGSNGGFTSSTTVNYNSGSGKIYDIAGNAWPTQAGLGSTDPTAPTIASGMIFNPDGGPANAEQIIFIMSEELSLAEGAAVTGFTVNGISPTTAVYTGKEISNTITLTSSGDGVWTQDALISYTPGNVQDISTNPLATFTNESILLKNVIIRSDNASPNSFAKQNDKIFLDFSTTSTLASAPIVTIDGGTALVSTGSLAPNYIYEITTTGATTEGALVFNIITEESDDSDSTNLSITTPGSQIIFDRTSPTITPISIASDYAPHPDFAKAGDKVTLTFSVADNLLSVITSAGNINIAGQAVTLGGSDPNFTAQTTAGLPGGLPETNIAFSILVLDQAGNSTTATAITTGSNVTFDDTNPTVTSIVVDPTSAFKGIGTTNGILATSTINFLVDFSEPVDGLAATDFAVLLNPNAIPGATVNNTGLTLTGGVDGDTQYTLRLDGVTGTGQVRLDYVANAAGITDLSGLITNNAPIVGEFFTVMGLAPSAQVSSPNTTLITQSQIRLNWTEGAPANPPTHYLLVAHGPTAGFPAIADGDNTLVDVDDITFNVDDQVIISVPFGTSFFLFNEGGSVTGLLAGARYDFRIYSYTLSPGTTTDNVDFNLVSPPATFGILPTAAQTTITNGTGPLTISSLNTSTANWTTVFSFNINDDNNFSTNNLPPYDNVPTKFSALVINQLNPVAGTNSITDWSQVIAAARLIDDELNIQEANVAVNPTNITVTNIVSEVTTDLGWVDDNETKNYAIQIYLKANMSGGLNYPEIIDNLNFHFEVDATSFTFDDTPSLSSTFNGVQSQNSGPANNVVEVLPTQLVFTTQPDANVGVNGLFPTTPVVTARDVNGNLDNNFNSTVVVTATNVGIGLINIPTAFPTGPTTGVLTFPANFGLDATGLTKVQVNSTTPALSIQSTDVTVSFSDGSQISLNSGNATISSLLDTEPEKIDAFSFKITDDASFSIVDDGIGTLVNQIVIVQGAGNDVVNWTHAIAGAKLFDGTSEITGVVNATDITFSAIPTGSGQFGEVADDGFKDFTLRIWLKSTIDPSIRASVDNDNLVFLVNEAGITVNALSSDLTNAPATSAETAGTDNKIDVIVTKLEFTTNPDPIASYDSDLPTTPVIEARDANNNIDNDYTGPLTIINTDGLVMTNNLNGDLNYTNGVITFHPNFQYAVGGPDGANGTLTVHDGVDPDGGAVPGPLTDAVSTGVTVNYSGLSDIIEVTGFSHTSNIDYTLFQENTNITNSGTSLLMERFKVRDGGASSPDDDGTPTILNEITLQIGNWENLRRIELYDAAGTTALPSTGTNEQVVTGEFITFTGLTLTAPDNGSIDFRVRVSFHGDDYPAPVSDVTRDPGAVDDNEAITFAVSTTLEDAFSSQFEFVNAGGTASTLAADENRIEVVADRVIFTSDINTSPSTFSDIQVPLFMIVKAKDLFFSTDVDYTGAIGTPTTQNFTPTNPLTFNLSGTPQSGNLPGNFIAGVYDFALAGHAPTLQYTLDGLTGELIIPAAGLTDGVSQTHDVFASEESVVELNPASVLPLIPYKDHVTIEDPTRYTLAEFIVKDGGIDLVDADGGSTVLKDITISLTNPGNLADIALYDDAGTLIPGTVQALPGTSVTWNGLSITAPDDSPKAFTIRAFFSNVVTDNHAIDIQITNVMEAGGSKFAFADGSTLGTGGALTTPGSNLINVVATQLDFNATLLDPEQGINIPITPNQPQVFANDEVGNLDLDFNFAATVTSGVSMGTVPIAFSNLSPGILDFPGFQYTSTGSGTITVQANGLIKISNAVDVIHTTFFNLDLGAGATNINNGISAEVLIPSGSVNRALLGFSVTADQTTLNEPTLNTLIVRFSNNITGVLENIRLFQSSDQSFSFLDDVDMSGGITTTVGSNLVTFSGLSDAITNNPTNRHYFFVADINVAADFSTPEITASLIASGIPNADVILTSGSVDSPLTGRLYRFDDINDPVVAVNGLVPFSGNNNFPQANLISIEFNESVIALDSILNIYLASNDTLISVLKLNPVLTSADSTTFFFDPTLPITGSPLVGDTKYYINIAKADTLLGIGFVDKSNNSFQGILNKTTWNFTTSDNVAPFFTSDLVPSVLPSDAVNIIDIGFDLRVSIDEPGRIYYIVVDPVATPGTPTVAEIRNGTFAGTILADSAEILKGFEYHYISVFDEATLPTGSGDFRVWITAQDIALPLPNQMVDSDPLHPGKASVDGSFTAAPGGIIIQNTPLNAPVDVCIGNFQLIFAPINIVEGNNNDFNAGVGQTINFILPPNFAYETNAVTVTGQGGDISNVSFSFINNTILTITYDISGTANRDKLIIGGMNVQALGSVGTTGDITRLGGTGATAAIPDGTILVSLNTVSIAPITFITVPNTTSIGDNILKVPLIPDPNNILSTEGTNAFSGIGVVGDTLFTAAAGLGTHTLFMIHTDPFGCVVTDSLQRSIFDSQQAIVGLNQIYCVDEPIDLIPFDGRSPQFNLVDLKVAVAPNQPTGINPLDPFLTNATGGVVPSLVKVGNDYRFEPAYFDSVGNFTKFTNEGGLIGELLFTGVYNNNLNTNLFDTLEQRVAIYIPPTNSITFTSSRLGATATFGNNIVDVANVDPNDPAFLIEYCEDDLDIVLDGLPNPATGSSLGFFAVAVPTVFAGDSINFAGLADQGDGSAILNTQTVADNFGFGDFDIKYIFENLTSQCNDTVTKTIRITPKPRAGFTSTLLCVETPIRFVDLSGYTPNDSVSVAAAPNNAILPNIVQWTWKFNDANSTGSNPDDIIVTDPLMKDSVRHNFRDAGIYAVDLSIINQFGCVADTTINMIVGGMPDTDFEFGGSSLQDVIRYQSTSTVVKSSATLDHAVDSLIWDFGDGTFFTYDDNDPTRNNDSIAIHTYASAGLYNVSLDAYSTVGCSTLFTKQVAILENQVPDSINIYSEDFEVDDGGWVTFPAFNPNYDRNVIGSKFLLDSISWGWGNPSKPTIIPGSLQGNNVWITGLTAPYKGIESSFVYSPSFDLSLIPRPMIAIDIYQQLEDGDGVILEFSTDTLNILDPLKTWQSVGKQIGEGENWFNGIGLAGTPGVDISGLGWERTTPDWVLARHSLGFTGLATIAERSRVIFRFAIGAVSQPKKDGFAFDNVVVGNRTRTVLLENFTNVAGGANTRVENDSIHSLAGAPKGSELVIIEYHTSFPGEDIMNQANKSDQDARALYYGISQTPRVAIDGTTDLQDRPFTQWGELFYSVRTLNVSPFTISLTSTQQTDGKLHVNAVLRALKNIAPNHVVHVAVVEKALNAVQLGSPTIATGETDFLFVLKTMLPDAGGTIFNAQLAKGDSIVIDQEWNPTNVVDVGNQNLRIIVFVQDELTKDIYQAAYIDPGFDPVLGIEEELLAKGITIYPNPADDHLVIILAEKETRERTGFIFDNTGRKVKELLIHAGENQLELKTSTFNPGLYHLQLESANGVKKLRFIITHR